MTEPKPDPDAPVIALVKDLMAGQFLRTLVEAARWRRKRVKRKDNDNESENNEIAKEEAD